MTRKLVAFLLSALLLSGTGVLAETLIDPTLSRGIAPVSYVRTNSRVAGESMTTGLPGGDEYVPVLVNIDNVAGAWPQWGIAQADIIYEMPIQGLSMTRLMALFTQSHPDAAGPVRSGRVMHAEMRQEWGSGWAFAGIQSKDGSNVNVALRELGARDGEADLIFNLNTSKWGKHGNRVKTHSAPHNLNLNVASVAATIADQVFPERPFLFSDELPVDGAAANRIRLVYGGNERSYTNSSYVYNQETNTYVRSRAGMVYEDMNRPGVPLAFSNVIVQWTDLRFNGSASAPLLTEVGQGNADIFTGGRHIAGYWIREDVNSRTIFFDQDGNEIRLQRGRTWINITTSRSTAVSYE